jgi:hypothetical protein
VEEAEKVKEKSLAAFPWDDYDSNEGRKKKTKRDPSLRSG